MSSESSTLPFAVMEGLSTVTATMSWVGVVVGVIAVFIGGIGLMSRGDRGGAYVRLAAGAMLIGVSLGLRFLGAGAAGRPSEGEPGSAPAAPAPSAPAPIRETGEPVAAGGQPADGGLDMMPIATLAGAVAAITVAALAIGSVVRVIRTRRSATRDRQMRWNRARAVFDEARSEYVAYLSDPSAWLERPTLEDITDPTTANFIDAFAVADALHSDAVPASDQRIDEFHRAATAALAAWEAAYTHAGRLGTTMFEPVSKAKLRRAASALRTAIDDTASPNERAAALEAVVRLTDGLVALPDRVHASTVQAIDTARRRALPAPPTT